MAAEKYRLSQAREDLRKAGIEENTVIQNPKFRVVQEKPGSFKTYQDILEAEKKKERIMAAYEAQKAARNKEKKSE